MSLLQVRAHEAVEAVVRGVLLTPDSKPLLEFAVNQAVSAQTLLATLRGRKAGGGPKILFTLPP